jgi:hypothetical protein
MMAGQRLRADRYAKDIEEEVRYLGTGGSRSMMLYVSGSWRSWPVF